MSGFLYLASPYSHPDPEVRHERFLGACRAAAHLMDCGHVVFSPIAHSHTIETEGLKEVRNGDFWKGQDVPILRHAARLVVLMLPGWRESRGIAWEIELAHTNHLHVEYMEPV